MQCNRVLKKLPPGNDAVPASSTILKEFLPPFSANVISEIKTGFLTTYGRHRNTAVHLQQETSRNKNKTIA
jgi:hypothetical protein